MIRVIRPRLPGANATRSSRTMWLISFTDLCSLMLGFFVMLYAMAEPEAHRWAELTRGLSARSTATTFSDQHPMPGAAFNGALIESRSRISLSYLSVLLHAQVRDRPELARVIVDREDDRLVIGLPGDLLFAGNGAAFSESGRRALFDLGEAVGRSGQRVEIVGHAAPVAAGWEMALGQAVAVAAALRATGFQTDLVARAVADPDRAGRPARIDIVVREQEG